MKMRLEKKALDKLFRRRDRIEIPDFQRGPVWSDDKSQAFMDTILKKWFVPVVFFRVIDEENFECIDGQQRLNAIFGFYNNDFPLSPKYSSKYGSLFYRDLPDKIKDVFDDYELFIVEIEEAEDSSIIELFQRLQLGVPLNAGEKMNAMQGDMRDFCVSLSKHVFLEQKVSVRDTRYAFLSICSQICLLELEGIRDAKFKNLKDFYERKGVFNKNSKKAQKILRVFEFLNKMFDSKVPELSNRASIISLYLLISNFIDKTSLKGKENSLKNFYINFLRELRAEVQKGPLAKDTELLLYQSAVNQAADSKESIQRRHDILMKRLFKFDKDFEQFAEKDAIAQRLEALEKEREIRTLSSDVVVLIGDCNEISVSKGGKEVFKITTKLLKRITDLEKMATTKDNFGNFVDALYEILYEGSGSLNRVPEIFKNDDDFIGFVIKFIRADFRHDLEHGSKQEIKKKKARLSKIYLKYSGKTAFSAMGKEDLVKVQEKMLEETKLFLQELKAKCITS
jgi:hypothetical protein